MLSNEFENLLQLIGLKINDQTLASTKPFSHDLLWLYVF